MYTSVYLLHMSSSYINHTNNTIESQSWCNFSIDGFIIIDDEIIPLHLVKEFVNNPANEEIVLETANNLQDSRNIKPIKKIVEKPIEEIIENLTLDD